MSIQYQDFLIDKKGGKKISDRTVVVIEKMTRSHEPAESIRRKQNEETSKQTRLLTRRARRVNNFD